MKRTTSHKKSPKTRPPDKQNTQIKQTGRQKKKKTYPHPLQARPLKKKHENNDTWKLQNRDKIPGNTKHVEKQQNTSCTHTTHRTARASQVCQHFAHASSTHNKPAKSTEVAVLTQCTDKTMTLPANPIPRKIQKTKKSGDG